MWVDFNNLLEGEKQIQQIIVPSPYYREIRKHTKPCRTPPPGNLHTLTWCVKAWAPRAGAQKVRFWEEAVGGGDEDCGNGRRKCRRQLQFCTAAPHSFLRHFVGYDCIQMRAQRLSKSVGTDGRRAGTEAPHKTCPPLLNIPPADFNIGSYLSGRHGGHYVWRYSL